MSHKKLVAIAIVIILVVPSTFLGILLYQMTSLQVSVDFDETQVLSWFWAILVERRMPDLSVRLIFTNPTFLTVDITDVYAQLYIEDQYALETTIENLFIPAGKTVYKDLSFTVTEFLNLIYSLISQASGNYGGEVKLTLTGHATAHLFLLSLRLPFSVDKYYMTKEGSLRLDSAEWTNENGQVISTAKVGTRVYVRVKVVNPTRRQTITSTVGVRVRRDIPFGVDETMMDSTQSVTLSPTSSTTISFSFTPPKSSGYHFDVFIDGEKVYTQPNTFPPRLRAS